MTDAKKATGAKSAAETEEIDPVNVKNADEILAVTQSVVDADGQPRVFAGEEKKDVYTSDNWTVSVTEKSGPRVAIITPKGWVGDDGLKVSITPVSVQTGPDEYEEQDRLAELVDLLKTVK